ncbi:MAG: hypothetical protein JRG73_04925 [Deltaproteobacteria bacterium]|nr:hypothetical protein [Deltaproteobacteria bacterium]MBW2306260.1 hypothetical protein [Deltaproteobacteria bacterium]
MGYTLPKVPAPIMPFAFHGAGTKVKSRHGVSAEEIFRSSRPLRSAGAQVTVKDMVDAPAPKFSFKIPVKA